MKIAFTLCSNNYLAQAKTLGDSLIQFNPDFTFIIGLVDRLNEDIDYSFFNPHIIIPVESIGINGNKSLIRKYNIVEYNTAVKPFYFDYLFSNYNTDTVTYFDPDIRIYGPIGNELMDIYKEYDFILTPHLLNAQVRSIPEMEQLLLNVGVFNLGFLGLRRSEQTQLFIDFLKNRLYTSCYIDFCNGLFVDQIWANLIPCYFSKYFIWKDPGCNVGYWNFSERTLSTKEGNYFVNSEYSLKFFHISNYNPLTPEVLCKWLSYSFEKRHDLKSIYDSYQKELLQNGYSRYSSSRPLLQFNSGLKKKSKKQKVKKIIHSALKRLGVK